MSAIYKKELRGYLTSMIGYVFIFLLLILVLASGDFRHSESD